MGSEAWGRGNVIDIDNTQVSFGKELNDGLREFIPT